MRLNESIVEDAVLMWFGELSYPCLGVEALAPTLSQGERATYGEVVPMGRLRAALRQIRPKIPDEARKDALRKVLRLDFPSRLSANSKQPRTLATLSDPAVAGLPKLLSGELKPDLTQDCHA